MTRRIDTSHRPLRRPHVPLVENSGPNNRANRKAVNAMTETELVCRLTPAQLDAQQALFRAAFRTDDPVEKQRLIDEALGGKAA